MKPAISHESARAFARKVSKTGTKPAATNLARAYLALSEYRRDQRTRRQRGRETLLLRRDRIRSGLERLLLRVDEALLTMEDR